MSRNYRFEVGYPEDIDEEYICPKDDCDNCTFDCENNPRMKKETEEE